MINVTKITEESSANTRTYYKLEQVKTYKPNIVKAIMDQVFVKIESGDC